MDDLFGVTEIAKHILDEEAAHNPAEAAEITEEKVAPEAGEAAAPGAATEHAENKE